MRYLLSFLVISFLGLTAIAQGPLITEIGYDNNYDQDDPFGIDSIEYVEVYLPNPQPADLTSIRVVTYNEGDPNVAEVGFNRDLTDALRTWDTPNGKYYVIEFADSTYFGFPIGGMQDGTDGVALVELGSPNIVHQFWRYETCEVFVAMDGPAAGASSTSITQDFSRVCGTAGASLVQLNSAVNTNMSIQQNGFGDWELAVNSAREFPLENSSNVPVELIDFNVRLDKNDAIITWSTAQETNNSHFEILHSTDARKFEKIQTVEGKGIYSGFSNYKWVEQNLESGIHYFRLKQVDFNGEFTLYDIRSVQITGDGEFHVYPTLVDSEITVENVKEDSEYQIINSQGKIVQDGTLRSASIFVAELPAGSYVLTLNGNYKRFLKL